MSSKSEMGRGKMPKAKKKKAGLSTKTGQMRAKQTAKRAATKAAAKTKVTGRKLMGNTGKKTSSGKSQKGGTPKRPSKVQSFIKRLRKGPSK